MDCSNLICMEMVVRRLQAYEEVVRSKAEEKMFASADGGCDSLASMQENFSGVPRMFGGALVYAPLVSYIAKKKSEEAELMKQQRKSFEARRPRGRGRG